MENFPNSCLFVKENFLIYCLFDGCQTEQEVRGNLRSNIGSKRLSTSVTHVSVSLPHLLSRQVESEQKEKQKCPPWQNRWHLNPFQSHTNPKKQTKKKTFWMKLGILKLRNYALPMFIVPKFGGTLPHLEANVSLSLSFSVVSLFVLMYRPTNNKSTIGLPNITSFVILKSQYKGNEVVNKGKNIMWPQKCPPYSSQKVRRYGRARFSKRNP